jgi:hypothetical protein
MELVKALFRIWRTWKFGFLIAIIIYGVVFYWAYNYEVQREEERDFGEDPIPLFQASISPAIKEGAHSYIVNITNNQKYTINELSIEFTGPNFIAIEDFQETYTDNVGRNGEKRFSNNVLNTAVSLNIILESQGVPGFTDINLYLENSDGSMTWPSTDTGNREEITLSRTDLDNYGYGEYTAIVKHERGLINVDFELIYRIYYGELVLKRETTTPIQPDQGRNFEFVLNLGQAQLSELKCIVRAEVELSEELKPEIGMTYNSDWEITDEIRPIPEEISKSIPWGPVDMTGTSSAILYTFTVIFGFAFFIRSKLKEVIMPTLIRRAHCFLSLTTLMFVFAHMSTAMQKDWPWESTGMRFAVIATILLVSFNIFSFFDVELIKSMGKKRWRLIHLAFTMAMALSIIIHFGLMGDHLGFLK